MKLKLVCVAWEDCASYASWKDVSEARRLPTVICHSYGWMLNKDERAVRLMASYIPGDCTVGQIEIIPKSQVRKITIIKTEDLDIGDEVV